MDISKISWILLFFSSIFVSAIFAAIVHLYYPNDWMITGKMMKGNIMFCWIWIIIQFFVFVFFLIQQALYRYRYSKQQYLFLISLGFTFYFLRSETFKTDGLVLDRISLFGDYFSYFDFIFLLLFISLVLSICRDVRAFFKKPGENNNIFLEDNPLHKSEDLTQYYNLLKQIEPVLFTDKYESAFSIGIIGPWGAGKSSFVRAVKEKVKTHDPCGEKIIFIAFSPFLNHNEDRVIHEFFIQLSDELKKRSGKLSKLLLNYSSKLSNALKDGNIFSLIKPSGLTVENESVGELYNEIDEVIRSLNLKIIITIDDLDRLNAKEIIQVLKLIRNTSNFPNLVFLVALDKEYVESRLRDDQGIKSGYLDKFFQLEIHVLKSSFTTLSKFIQSSIVEHFTKYGVDDKNTIVQFSLSFETNELYCEWIKTYRDAKRVINQFILDYKLINTNLNTPEIAITDIYHLTLLKLNSPGLFDDLRNGRFEDLNLTNSWDVIGYYFEEIGQKENDPDLDNITFSRSELSKFKFTMEGDQIVFSHKKYSVDSVLILLNLFGNRGTVMEEILDFQFISESSIRRIKNLQFYFEKTVPEEELLSSQFSEIYYSQHVSEVLDELYHYNYERLERFVRRVLEIIPTETDEYLRKVMVELLLLRYPELGESQPKFNLSATLVQFAKYDKKAFNKYMLEFAVEDSMEMNMKASFLIFSHDLRDYIDLNGHVDTNPISRILLFIKEDNALNKLKLVRQLFIDFSDKTFLDIIAMHFRSFVGSTNVEEILIDVILDSKEEFNRYSIDPVINRIYGSNEGFKTALERVNHPDLESKLLSKVIELLGVLVMIEESQIDYVFDINSPFYDFHEEKAKTIQLFLEIREDVWNAMKEEMRLTNFSFDFDYKILNKNSDSGLVGIFIPRLLPKDFDNYHVFTTRIHQRAKKVIKSSSSFSNVSGLSLGHGVVVNRSVISEIISIQRTK